MPHSILEAIKQGRWDYEPDRETFEGIDPTGALPGSNEKLAVLAKRIERGEPLWHPSDRLCFDDNKE